MAGRVKATWHAAIERVARHLHHHYEGNTCTGMSQRVLLRVTLDREPDRLVEISLTVKQARKYANALNYFADKAETENEEWGVIEND